MVTSLCLLACAMTVGQASDRTEFLLAPQLTQGQELVYKGGYLEESLIPNVEHRQEYGLTTHVLTLHANKRSWEIAVMTALSQREAGQREAVQREAVQREAVQSKQEKHAKEHGAPGPTPGPTSVRLDLLQVDSQGRLKSA